MREIMKSKKADVSITLLVVMVLVVSSVALLSFTYADYKQTKQALMATTISEFEASESSFEFFLNNIADETLSTMLKSMKPEEIAPADFAFRFGTTYDKYALLENCPAIFKTSEIYSQIRNAANYDVKVEGGMLKLRIKEFNFSASYDPASNQGIKDIKIKKDMYFEIPASK